MRAARLAILLLAAPLFAQPAIVADRPGLADGPSTVGAGTVQLETGVTVEEDDGSLTTLPTLVRIGLTGALELRIESSVLGVQSGDRDWAPLAAGFKLRLRDSLSLLASVQPPSGGGTMRSDAFETSIRLVGERDLGGGFTLVPNAGIAHVEGEGVAGIVAASIERGSGNATPFIDFELEFDDGDTAMIADAGIAWLAGNDTQLDLSAGVEISGESYPEWFVAAGISRRF